MHRSVVLFAAVTILGNGCDLPNGPREARDRLARGEDRVIHLEVPFPRLTIALQDYLDRAGVGSWTTDDLPRPDRRLDPAPLGASAAAADASFGLGSAGTTLRIPSVDEPQRLPVVIASADGLVTVELVVHNYVRLTRAMGGMVGNIGESLLSGAFRLEVTNASPLGYEVGLALAPTPRDTTGFNPFQADRRFVMTGIDIPVADVGQDRRVRPVTVTSSVDIPTEDLGVFRAGRLSLALRLTIEPPRRIPNLDRLDYYVRIDPVAVLELLAHSPEGN